MSVVTIRDVIFLNNPARFSDDYKFRVTFECIAPLKDDLEWKLIFVSSPDKENLDQELDDCMVGPVPVGVNSFEFSSPAPNPQLIPKEDALGVAAIILTGAYRDQEFVRVGYYQNTEYDNQEMNENRPENIVWDRLVRDVSNKPRVTRFSIKWDTDHGVQSAPSIPGQPAYVPSYPPSNANPYGQQYHYPNSQPYAPPAANTQQLPPSAAVPPATWTPPQ